VAEKPGSDDFHTYARASQTPTMPAVGQISLYAQIHGAGPHPRAFWLTTHQEMRQLAQVVVHVHSALTTSASAEHAFSVARRVCGDRQMAMTQETIASRVMIQASWTLAGPLVEEALAMASLARAQVLQSRQRPWEDTDKDTDKDAGIDADDGAERTQGSTRANMRIGGPTSTGAESESESFCLERALEKVRRSIPTVRRTASDEICCGSADLS
jgi:hypothetical protein